MPSITPLADGTRALACLSQELRPYAGTDSGVLRIATGSLISKTADKVGEISIPRSLKDQASTAIAKVHNAVQYVIANNPYDQPVTVTPNGRIPSALDYQVPPGIYFIQGGINFAQLEALSQRDIEILGPGVSSKVQKYNVALHFEMIQHPEATLVGIPVEFRMDFYSMERGASAFFVTGGGLIRGEFLETRAPNMIEAYQRLTDIAVAALLRQLAVKRFGLTPTGSPGCLDVMPATESIPNLSRGSGTDAPVTYTPDRGFCVSLPPAAGGNGSQSVSLVWLQYIGVRRLIQRNKSIETLTARRSNACFPSEQLHGATTTMEVKVLDAQDKQIAAGSVALPLSP